MRKAATHSPYTETYRVRPTIEQRWRSNGQMEIESVIVLTVVTTMASSCFQVRLLIIFLFINYADNTIRSEIAERYR